VNKGVNIPPRGQISPLGAKFNLGQVHPWGPGVKLRMALRSFFPYIQKAKSFSSAITSFASFKDLI
jgi:hypothetical protein